MQVQCAKKSQEFTGSFVLHALGCKKKLIRSIASSKSGGLGDDQLGFPPFVALRKWEASDNRLPPV
jgi:hypothetical protein